MTLVKNKMTRIKQNSHQVQQTISEILDKLLQEMHEHIQRKSNILKSDRQELIR